MARRHFYGTIVPGVLSLRGFQKDYLIPLVPLLFGIHILGQGVNSRESIRYNDVGI